MRAWCADEFAAAGIEFLPAQANMAWSRRKGTIRGMHYQTAPALEAKLVRCTRGAVFDVVVDMRTTSATYKHWFGVELTVEKGNMLFVPEGCAHGCLSLTDESEIYYMASCAFAPDYVQGVRFDDPEIGIEWPISVTVASEQDRNWPLL